MRPTDEDPPGAEESVWDRIENYTKANPEDVSFEAFLNSAKGTKIPLQERERLRSYVAGFHAAELDQIGLLGLVKTQNAEEAIQGERSHRIPAGYFAWHDFFMIPQSRWEQNSFFDSPVESVK